jgi:hypothetical protein
MDLRWETADGAMQAIGETPQSGDMGVPGALIIKAGIPAESTLLLRMTSTNPTDRMPPLATSLVDPDGTDIITEWILSLGVDPQPRLSASMTPIDFGDALIGDASTTRTVTLSNVGAADLIFTGAGIEIVGVDPGEFAFAPAPSTAHLPASESREIHVVFSPTSQGIKSAKLRITTNDPVKPLVEIDLTGEGVPVPAPNVNLSLSSYNFGSRFIGEPATDSLTATVRNQGTATLTFTGVGFEIFGPDATSFQIVNAPSTAPLGPGESRAIEIAFTPTAEGAHAAQLRVTTDDPDTPTAIVNLSGQGLVGILAVAHRSWAVYR